MLTFRTYTPGLRAMANGAIEPHAAGLVRHCSRARLYWAAVHHRELWRPIGQTRRDGSPAAAHLPSGACHLLHVPDIFWFVRPPHPDRVCFPGDLYRAHRGDRTALSSAYATHPTFQCT